MLERLDPRPPQPDDRWTPLNPIGPTAKTAPHRRRQPLTPGDTQLHRSSGERKRAVRGGRRRNEFVDDLESGFQQLLGPVTCGLNGINPVTGESGSCSREQLERRDALGEAGEAVCETSRAPIIGSAFPEPNRESVGWGLVGNWWAPGALRLGAVGGVRGASGAAAGATYVAGAATAVDAYCRWGQP